MAAPIAAPRIASSEIGVSAHAARAESVQQSHRCLEYPSGPGNVLAEEHHAFVALHLLGDGRSDGVAIAQFRHAVPPSAQRSVNAVAMAGAGEALQTSVACSTCAMAACSIASSVAAGTPSATRRRR